MSVFGLHHITLVCSNAQRTVDFYVGVLGLRFIKKTVNFDDPGSYHLYFGNYEGKPGSAVTFFEWPHAPRGRAGIGGTHHFALTVENYDGLLKWKRRLSDLDVRVDGPYNRYFFRSIYFRDPDGTRIEIATQGPGFNRDGQLAKLDENPFVPPHEFVKGTRDERSISEEIWPVPVPEITSDMALATGMHHISATSSNIEHTHEFYSGLLGMKRIIRTSSFDDLSSAHWFWGNEQGSPGTLISYFAADPKRVNRSRIGAGQTHHFALAVKDADVQLEYREKLIEAGLRVSPVMDRVYFKSIYTSDPDGHIVELATLGPGFAVDEPLAELGSTLRLPPWLEKQRAQIETRLEPIAVPDLQLARFAN